MAMFTCRPISNWEGIPDDIDDALQYSNGYTYFFKRGLYYRFDDRKFKVCIVLSPDELDNELSYTVQCTVYTVH